MKKTIRTATFETNSSSVHSFVYIEPDLAERWRNGEVLIHFPENVIDEIAYEISEEDVVEMYLVDGDGIHPARPFSWEGYFPYRMFVDSDLEEEWVDAGTLWTCEMIEADDGSIKAKVSYMG